MRVTAYCPACLKGDRFDTGQAPVELVCPRCGARRPVALTPSVRDGMVDVCALCGGGHFYVETDFNKWLGGLVLVAAVAASTWAYTFNVFLSVGILAAAAALDFAALKLWPLRTTCYKCLAEYRGGRRNPQHGTYDLGIAARFADDYERMKKGARR